MVISVIRGRKQKILGDYSGELFFMAMGGIDTPVFIICLTNGLSGVNSSGGKGIGSKSLLIFSLMRLILFLSLNLSPSKSDETMARSISLQSVLVPCA